VRLVWHICILLVVAGVSSAESLTIFQLGVVIPKVECLADARQSYALYLPTSYRKEMKSPILFVFEPLARGPLPVVIMRQAAEKYGFIIIASNNSHNGPVRPQLEAANAMWRDAHQRFSIAPNRTYFAGFSGGARLAITFASACKGCAAGVAASGAGFLPKLEPKHIKGVALFTTVGYEDFNYPEILQLETKLKDAKATYHVRRFNGVHEWPPAEVWEEAFAWFNLQAMKSATLSKDETWIASAYRQALTAAVGMATAKKELEALRTYRQAVADFEGLTDVTEAQQHAAELEKSNSVKEAAKLELRQADDQARMTEELSLKIEALMKDPNPSAGPDIHYEFESIRKHANNDSDPQQLAPRRALAQELIHTYEDGAQLLENKDYRGAIVLL
jgi:dienelactone hydrolase